MHCEHKETEGIEKKGSKLLRNVNSGDIKVIILYINVFFKFKFKNRF